MVVNFSRVYGTANEDSDHDYIIVVKDTFQFKHNVFDVDGGEYSMKGLNGDDMVLVSLSYFINAYVLQCVLLIA